MKNREKYLPRKTIATFEDGGEGERMEEVVKTTTTKTIKNVPKKMKNVPKKMKDIPKKS